MITGGNNLYVSDTGLSANIILTVQSSPNNKTGRQIAIKNTSTKQIILQADSGMSLTGSTTIMA